MSKPQKANGRERYRILFITPWYPNFEATDGMFVQELARAVQSYHDVIVLHHVGKNSKLRGLTHIEQDRAFTKESGITVYRFWYREMPIPHTSYLFFGFWSLYQAFRSISKNHGRPELIHVHVYAFGALAILLGKIFNIPIIITEHSTSVLQHHLTPMQKRLARFAFTNANFVLPVSESLQRAIHVYGKNINSHVVPNVVNPEIFYPAAPCPNCSSIKKHELLFVGSLGKFHKKGIPYLLQALHRLQHRDDWHMTIVGDGISKQDYEQLSIELKLAKRVSFLGTKSQQDVAELMRNCAFFVLPSRVETFGVVLIEALSSGKPVIATLIDGPREFVTEEVGLLVAPEDEIRLAEVIDKMLDSYQNYEPDNLSAYVKERFGPETVADQVNQVYTQVLTPYIQR